MKTFTKNYYPFARLLLLVTICAIGAVAAKAANPTIIIIGDNPYRHQVNTPYADPGATATDDMGNDITALITTDILVNENAFGAYQVKYTVTDGNGNTAMANRTVIVTDVIRPTLNINPQVIVVDLNDFNFVEPTVTATDNYYPAVNLTRTGSFDVTIEGTYPIFYEANDASGNSDTGTRLIIVRKRGATGISDINAESFRVYPNPTAGKFEIEFAVLPGEKANLAVINTLGQTIRAINTTEIINGKIAVDMSSAAPGIYFIQIQTGEKVATQKLTLSR